MFFFQLLENVFQAILHYKKVKSLNIWSQEHVQVSSKRPHGFIMNGNVETKIQGPPPATQ